MITTRMYENMREMRDQPAMVVYAIAGLLLVNDKRHSTAS